jgi:soluble lytic murein transglycosylase
MARVPVYDREVTPGNLPNARVNVAMPDGAFGATQARQMQQLGDGMGRLAQGMRLAQEEADTARVNDALNQLLESELDLTYSETDGYTRLKGVQALQRPNNRALSDEYAERLQTRSAEIMGALGNDRQRQLFQERANQRLAQFRGNLMNYEGRENQDYQISVAQGSAMLASREIASFYNDPLRVSDAAERIRSAVVTEGRLRGKAAVEIQAEADVKVSAAHLGAVQQIVASGNPLAAERYLRQYKDDFTETDLLKARGAVEELANLAIGNIKAEQVLQEYVQQAEPADYDRALHITMMTESSGRRYGSDGKLLTSPAGAQGEMQVMPYTAADPGYGVRPAQDDSPEELARVGREYFGAMLREYDGDLALAWAAYNAGPGAVDKARREAARANNPGGWLERLPQETRDYVLKNVREYYNGGGRPEAPTPDELHARLAEDPDLQQRPGALRKAQEELNRRLALHERGVKARREDAYMQAMQHIENGGRYDTIPPEVKNALDPAKWSALRKYEETVRNGGRQQSDLATYQMLASNPGRVRDMTDAEFYALRQDLSESDFKKFADMRGANPSGSNNPGDLDVTAINRIVDSRLQSMGLDPKADKGSAAARVGAIRKTILDLVSREQTATGKKFNDAELTRLIDEEFLRTRAFKSESWLSQFSNYFSGSDGVRKRTLFGFTVSDIPREVRDRIEADYVANGFEKPTDQQLLEAFFMGEILTR